MPGALSLPGYHLQVVLMMTTLPTNCMSGAAFNILWKTKQPWPSNIPIPLPSELRDKQSWNEPNEQLWMVQSFIANPEKVWRLCGLDGGLCIWADKMEQISWIDPCDNGTGAMKDGRFRALSSDLEYWSGHRGRKIQYDGSRTPEFNLKDIQKRPRWEFIGVWGILHTLIAVIRFEEPRVKLNGLEAGSLYFFQANFFDQQITVCGVVRVVSGYLLAPGAGFELTRQQRLESLVGRPMPKLEKKTFRDDFSLQFLPRRFGAGYLVPSDAPMEYHLRAEMHKAQVNTFDAWGTLCKQLWGWDIRMLVQNMGKRSFPTDQNELFYWKLFRNEDGDEIEPLTSSDSPTSIKLVPCMKLMQLQFVDATVSFLFWCGFQKSIRHDGKCRNGMSPAVREHLSLDIACSAPPKNRSVTSAHHFVTWPFIR